MRFNNEIYKKFDHLFSFMNQFGGTKKVIDFSAHYYLCSVPPGIAHV